MIEFVNEASRYESNIKVEAISLNANAKSLMSFSLAVVNSKNLLIRAEGPDALEAIRSLSCFFNKLDNVAL
ncbi:HPr family phosphocarrier protein [Ammoniphilus sp. 3BR4]|uniref:HPr family phosphocarrier protein n=1 Tax=Ammoniphilus sp. 3BR4 TaxID=3158265 RepID=UPI003467935D